MKKILILDDDARICKLLADHLAERGHQCLPAGDAEMALECLRAGPVDLVVADLLMPGKSGASFVREILSNYPQIPVIVVTGALKEAKDAERMLKAGVKFCFAKPFNLDVLVRKAEETMGIAASRGPGPAP